MGETKLPETTFDAASNVGKLWEDMRQFYAVQGKPPAELTKEVDQGFLADPLGIREFRNIAGTAEVPEVFQWCYAHGDCHPLLVKHGYPLFFGMNDFNPDQWVDDQERFEMESQTNRMVQQQNGSGRKKMVEKIFEWSLQTMRFNNDCVRERSDWEALFHQCGACSESTSALYFPYAHAGLNPEFYYEGDWEPSLRWLDRYESAGNSMRQINQDHVLLGIPMEDDSVFFVDRINRELNGSHPFAVPLSAMNYSGLLLRNLIPLAFLEGQAEHGLRWTSMEAELVPGDPFALLENILALNGIGLYAEALKIREALAALEHPAKEILLQIADLEPRWLVEAAVDGDHPLRRQLAAMEESHPQIASRTYFLMAALFSEAFVNKNRDRFLKAIQMGGDHPILREFPQLVVLAVRHYVLALRANPNAVKAYLGLMALLDNYSPMVRPLPAQVAGLIEPLLKQNPNHAPLHYLRGKALGTVADHADRKQQETLLREMLGHFQIMAESAPLHPSSYFLEAKVHLLLDEKMEAWPLIEKGRQLSESPYSKSYYETLVLYAFQNGDDVELKRAIRQLLGDRRQDGLEMALEIFGRISNVSFLHLHEKMKLDASQKKEVSENGMKMVGAVEEVLGRFPRAQLVLEAVRARNAVAVGLLEGRGGWRKILGEITDKNRPEVKEGFRVGLMVVDDWLSSKFQNEETADWLRDVLDEMATDLPRDLHEKWISIEVELANNYIQLGRSRKAAEVMDKMMERDTTKALTFYAGRVIGMSYDSWRKNLDALDILFDRREKIAPQVRQALAKGYQKLLGLAESQDEENIRRKIAELTQSFHSSI